MKLILVDGNGTDLPKDFSCGFNVEKDLIRCFFGHVAATEGKFFPLNKFTFERCDILILMFSHSYDANILTKIAKAYLKTSTITCCLYKDDWERFTKDINNKPFFDSFVNLSNLCDIVVSCNEMHVGLLELYTNKPIVTLPICHPMKRLSKYITKVEDRRGIFVASYQCKRFLRQTLHAAKMAVKLGEKFNQPVTIMNPENNQVLNSMAKYKKIIVLDKALPFIQWLQLLGKHILSLNFDICGTSGQVQLDAAAMEEPCIGSNSHASSIVHRYCGKDHFDYTKYKEISEKLLLSFVKNRTYYNNIVDEIRTAKQLLDYGMLRKKIYKVIKDFK